MEALRETRLREREEEDRHAGLLDEGEKGKGKAPSWPEDEIVRSLLVYQDRFSKSLIAFTSHLTLSPL